MEDRSLNCSQCNEPHPRCYAHKKRKNSPDGKLHPCMQHPIKWAEHKKCKMHGGKSLKGIASPTFKTGKTSKVDYLPKQLTSRAENLLSDSLTNLEESIQIQKVLETEYLEKLETTESTAAWEKLNIAVNEYDEAAHLSDKTKYNKQKAKAFGTIKFIVKNGLSRSFLVQNIQGIQETQRKNIETLSKVRKEQQEVYTSEDVRQMLDVIMRAIRNNVSDRKVLNKINADLEVNTVQ